MSSLAVVYCCPTCAGRKGSPKTLTNPAQSGLIRLSGTGIILVLGWATGAGEIMDDRWFSVDEIAEYLGVSRDTVYAWLNKREMPGHKVGRLWEFKRVEVDAWVWAGRATAISIASTARRDAR